MISGPWSPSRLSVSAQFLQSGLVRYFVLFVIDLKTRRIEIAGILPQPDGAWMNQIARNLTDAESGFLNGSRYLIHDRDPLFTKSFRETLGSSGVETVKLPARSTTTSSGIIRGSAPR